MVLGGPGGYHDLAALVCEVLSDAAVVPAVVIEINHYQSRLRPRHLKDVVENIRNIHCSLQRKQTKY